MKNVIAILFLLTFLGCEVHTFPGHRHHHSSTVYVEPEPAPVVYVETVTYEEEVAWCDYYSSWQDPFPYAPMWCDSYATGYCCTWDLYDGSPCSEEWCYDDYCGWEYIDTPCYF